MFKKNIIIIFIVLLILIFGYLLYRNKNLPNRSIISNLTPTATPIRSTILPPGGDKFDQDYYIEKATSDLATKLNIDSSTIKVVSVTEHDWGDTSLGCPEKGKMYAQVITPGFIIVLTAGGNKYIYHSGGKSVITCQR